MTTEMKGLPVPSIQELEKMATIMSTIITTFNFKDSTIDYKADDFYNHLKNIEKIEEGDSERIKIALKYTPWHTTLQNNYSLFFLKHQAKEDGIQCGVNRFKRGFRI